MRYSRLVLPGLAALLFAGSASGAPGDLDLTFDGDGKVITDMGSGYDFAHGVALQDDGKIVAAGSCGGPSPAPYDFCLARYNPDGSLDTSFDSDGKVYTGVGASTSDEARAVSLQGDGKILAAGYCEAGGGSDFCLARYNPDGSLDTGFDGDGRVITDMGGAVNYADGVALQSDGKIVVAGFCGPDPGPVQDFCLARYNSDGSLDTAFDGDGKVITDWEYIMGSAQGIAIQADGKVVAAGSCGAVGGPYDFCLARYNPDGSLDTSFDVDGKVTTDIGGGSDFAHGVALQGDGKIIAAGNCSLSGDDDVCLARYLPDGRMDTSFGGDGTVTTDIGVRDRAMAVALQGGWGDWKIVVAGYCTNTDVDFCLARYEDDPDWDGDGVPNPGDNCPLWPNPTQTAPPWGVIPGDPDCDGFSDGDEGTIGTHPEDPCADNTSDDAWPSDFDMNKVVNISDVFYLLPPYFGRSVPPTSARRDLAPDGVINISDVFKVLPPYFGASCT